MDRITAKGFNFYAGGEKWFARGITYGPFSPDEEGHCYPPEKRLRRDFEHIKSLGINVIRLYTVPPKSLAKLAEEYGLRLLIDVSWPKHLGVYGKADMEEVCLEMVDETIGQIKDWPNVLGVFLGNEIPADLVRWSGASKVASFLNKMYERAKEQYPELLVGFSNYPSTEYLPLPFFDFIGFNVYLHEYEDMHRYFLRLRHLYPNQPLILSETGVDTQSCGEEEQARVLGISLRIAFAIGMAGAFVFSWTDEWFTGGYEIDDWSFGITDAKRRPKPALDVVSTLYKESPHTCPVDDPPKISVVVATYNGGETLAACLKSLQEQKYKDYEIIVVDDGSTDNTAEILKGFRDVKVVSQENKGLSAARNAGIEAANGDIVAFTDSDCIADCDWLYHIGCMLALTNYAGVGGPNLTPLEEREMHRIVGAAPGHATHVLFDEEEAEHVPGCNMAFWKNRLLEQGAFDPQFRAAGDDVDMIWRLQDAGMKVGFAAGAFVWHHRRSTMRAYLNQQIGYGKAEALLLRKHPHRFNDRGQSLWRGVIYTGHEDANLLRKPDVYYGIFCSSGFQCVYQRNDGLLVHVLTSLEWWLVTLCVLLVGLISNAALFTGIIFAILSLAISGGKAWKKLLVQKDIPHRYFPFVWFLWAIQPIVREGSRYWSHLTGAQPSAQFDEAMQNVKESRRLFRKSRILEYWGEKTIDRVSYLRELTARLTERKWIFFASSGWEPWDLIINTSSWFRTRVVSAEEELGDQQRVLRLGFRSLPTSLLWTASAGALLVCGLMALHNTEIARYMLVGFILIYWYLYKRAFRARILVQQLADRIARENGYILVKPKLPAGQRESHDLYSVPQNV